MSDVVEGYKHQVWRIIKYEGVAEVWEERIPLEEATEDEVRQRLERLVRDDMDPTDVEREPDRFRATRDAEHGERVMLLAGDDPSYVASLWREDELPGPL